MCTKIWTNICVRKTKYQFNFMSKFFNFEQFDKKYHPSTKEIRTFLFTKMSWKSSLFQFNSIHFGWQLSEDWKIFSLVFFLNKCIVSFLWHHKHHVMDTKHISPVHIHYMYLYMFYERKGSKVCSCPKRKRKNKSIWFRWNELR